jgi:SulP family sulfate permease
MAAGAATIPHPAPLRELTAGAVGSLAALALMVSQALLAHAPLGAGAVASGLAATAVTCGVAGIGYAVASRARLPAAGPSMTTALILAALYSQLVNAGADVGWVLAAGGLALSLSGLIQLLGASFGLAQLVRLVPRPVLAGFINGVALLMATSQIPLLLGLPPGMRLADWLAAPWQLGALALGLAAVAVIVTLDRARPGLPSALIALLLGTAAYAGLQLAWPGLGLGPPVGPVPIALPHPLALAPLVSADGWQLLLTHSDAVLGTAVVLALISSLESALNLQALDQLLQDRHDPKRELMCLGAANLLCGLLAGLPAVAQLARSSAIHRAGGHGALAAGGGAAVLVVVFVAAAPLVAPLPLAVLGGIVLVIAWGMLDRWTLRLLAPWQRAAAAAELRGGLAVMALVCGLTLWRGFTAGVAAGVLLSMAIFIVRMNRPPLRQRSTAAERPSRRIYPAKLELQLVQLRPQAVIWDLEGALFFGNADRVLSLADTLPADVRVLVIDLKRVTFVDESGAAAVATLGRTLQQRAVPVLLAGLVADGAPARALAAIAADLPQWPDADHAAEAAERLLLGRRADHLLSASALAESVLLRGLSADQQAVVHGLMQAVHLQPGETLFNQGDPANGLYVLTLGSVSIVSGHGDGRRRLVSLSPGMMLGESGWIEGGTRSAQAVADQPSLLHHLDALALQSLQRQHPQIVAAMYCNIAVFVAGRLRSVNAAWWASQA